MNKERVNAVVAACLTNNHELVHDLIVSSVERQIHCWHELYDLVGALNFPAWSRPIHHAFCEYKFISGNIDCCNDVSMPDYKCKYDSR